jgi:hypothetical protein
VYRPGFEPSPSEYKSQALLLVPDCSVSVLLHRVSCVIMLIGNVPQKWVMVLDSIQTVLNELIVYTRMRKPLCC